MSTEQEKPDRQRRRRAPAIAMVTAAVLVAGGGGAYLAATAFGDSGPVHAGPERAPAPPPLALDGYSAGGGPGAATGIAPGEPDPSGTRYRATGDLPDGPGKAAVYRAEGTVSAADVARLGGALGLGGTPRLEGGAWILGPAKAGSGPSLRVNRAAPGTWMFTQAPCSGGPKCHGVGSGSAGDAVSAAVAEKAAAPVLKALGQDDAKLDAEQVMGATRVVNADPEVGGLPTYGWTTGVQVGPGGRVIGGSGTLKAPVKGATYPVISAERTLALMNRAAKRSASGGGAACATSAPLGERDRPDAVTAGGACGPPSPPRPPASVTATVTKATFGLAARYVDGGRALVPSWLFQVAPAGSGGNDGRGARTTVTHTAVDPAYLVAPGSGSASASPAPSGGGGTVTRDVRIEGYDVDASGRALTLHFTGGVCQKYTASASEGPKRVTVRVTERSKKGTICEALAKFHTLRVSLHSPLDGRKVVGTDGHAVPPATMNHPGGVS
ncbi:hypothetical protein [Streptomyces beihaiensis]|uniref:Large membrane protein n=1 Tax=Streptomyces beihaiensis TaxID=2984495 RepID=A0ABT3TWL2_9ACTN|nr:hypothetical protein [Streptomyces beihaiensis]MCX3061424.1 hypothetical protein [Streptomyces beihaiensis]